MHKLVYFIKNHAILLNFKMHNKSKRNVEFRTINLLKI